MTAPDISVVVCTKNRAALLQGALASLYDLATEEEFTYEIVVIDNGSTDETPRVIVEAQAQSKHPLRGAVEREPGIVASRNRGIREARGRWVAFLDDDQLADWHWLAELYRTAEEKGCRVVGGSVQLALPADCKREFAPTVLLLLGESMGGDVPQRFGGRLNPGCGNLLVQRSVFDQVGVFEAAIDSRGEYPDLYERLRRARIDAWYVPTAIIHHLTPPEMLEREFLLNLAERMGRGMALRHRKSLGWPRFAFLWLAKLVRIAVLDYPLLIRAGLNRNEEVTLGRRCQLTISQGYLNGVCAPHATVAKAKSAGVESTEAKPAKSAAGAKAMVYTLRNGEPTAVMEFPAFHLAAPASTGPVQR